MISLCACVGNCTDPNRSVDVSFRVCQFPWPANGSDTVSVYAYTNVTCGCPRGDITVQVHLPKEKIADYSTLDATPDPELLNASRCARETEDSDPHSYCISFTDLSMAEELNGSSLVSQVTKAVEVTSSQSCLKIIIQGMLNPMFTLCCPASTLILNPINIIMYIMCVSSVYSYNPPLSTTNW